MYLLLFSNSVVTLCRTMNGNVLHLVRKVSSFGVHFLQNNDERGFMSSTLATKPLSGEIENAWRIVCPFSNEYS